MRIPAVTFTSTPPIRRPRYPTSLIASLFAFLVFFPAQRGLAQPYQRNVLAAWDFTAAADPLGWSPIVPVNGFGVANGVLNFKSTGNVNILLSPSFSAPGARMQLVELQLSSDTAGPSTLFWAPAASGQYGGFQPGVQTAFEMVGDGAMHHYYIPFDGSAATTVYRLRIDVPSGASIALRSVALVNLTAPSGSGVAPLWTFQSDNDMQGWTAYSGVFDTSVSAGVLTISAYTTATLLAPNAAVKPTLEWFTLRASVTQTNLQQPHMEFNYVSASNGANSHYLALNPDGAEHTYNLNVGGSWGYWAGVSQLSISITAKTALAIRTLQVSGAPQGPADLALEACGPAAPLVRSGSTFQLSCRLNNRGPQTTGQLSAALSLPDDGSIQLVTSPNPPATLDMGNPQTLTWTLSAAAEGSTTVAVSASSQYGGSASANVPVLVLPAVDQTQAAYVPPPVPVDTGYELGLFYFPGWSLYSKWSSLRNVPERKPVLGYYAEGDSKVLDWQIKWAVEHGIRFFVVDHIHGGKGMASTMRGEWPNGFLDAYASARYRGYIRYCLAYSNNTAGATADNVDDFLSIMRSWLVYFRDPRYYTIGGKPLVFILFPQQLESNLNGGVAAAFAAARQMAIDNGLAGLYFIGNTTENTSLASRYLADGYDGLSAYGGYPYAGLPYPNTTAPEAPYSGEITAVPLIWDAYASNSSVPYYLPVGAGWDPSPVFPYEYGGAVSPVRTNPNAADYEALLRLAKDRVDAGNAPNVLMLDAWNELSEGHWIEPTAARGFSYLDAIRRVFAGDSPHTDVGPPDVGLPLVETAPSTALWTFTGPEDLKPWQPWQNAPFYDYVVNISNSAVTSKGWNFTTAAGAQLARMDFELPAANYTGVAFRISVSADTGVKMYWGAVDMPGLSEQRSASFVARAGPVQTYVINTKGLAWWRGVLNTLSLAFYSPAPVNVTIESIQFLQDGQTPARIVASKPGIQFTWVAGTAPPSRQTLSLAGASGGTPAWTAKAGDAWVGLSSLSGAAPSNITVSVDPKGLSPGVHQSVITVSGAADIPITLWVVPAP